MKNGFTLIELLAVIVILAIVALIATPIILNIIDDTKEQAFEQSVNGIVKSANIKSLMELKTEEILYKYENKEWVENKLNIDGQIPKYVEIKVNKEGKVRYAITDGKYCAIKEYDSKINIKKVGNENNDKKFPEKYCKLDAVIPTQESCFEYSEYSTYVTIKGYKCTKNNSYNLPVITDLIIPEKIKGKKVSSIAYSSFRDKNLKSVIIPNGVRDIGDLAFADNEITDIVLPNSVINLGRYAFMSNKLTSVTIPNNVHINEAAFADNELPDEQAFIYNRENKTIDYTSLNSYGGKKKENVIIPDNVINIGIYAFANSSIISVTIPNSVKNIGDRAFQENSLENVIIPESVTNIGMYAFSGNKLTSVIIPKYVAEVGDSAFSKNQLTNVTIKGKSSASDFTSYPTSSPFGWASGYSDSNINWD